MGKKSVNSSLRPAPGGYRPPPKLPSPSAFSQARLIGSKSKRKSAGQIAFEAYTAECGGINHDGTKIRSWEDLGSDGQAGWEAAAYAVLAAKV